MAKIVLDINKCSECPYVKVKRCWTSDSFEHAYDYLCPKNNNKLIAGYVEWEREIPEVPDDCPLLLK